ncbi:unnamed protein product [Strongylus vulgaris]|uniref:Uncharacterized protein n=1 Tax=Strongylus vulgaris TaxID=40348 RepID=A0A3P7JYP4_STRVU|nr:unnamed protein product [Strongylus vulgaris]
MNDHFVELITSVLAIVNESGNTDLELKITLEREDNGLPKAIFELVPKAHLSNPVERLNRAYVQYAKDNGLPKAIFELVPKARLSNPVERLNRAYVQYAKFHEQMGVASDCETAISQQRTPKSTTPAPDQQGSRFSLLSVFNSVFSGLVSIH